MHGKYMAVIFITMPSRPLGSFSRREAMCQKPNPHVWDKDVAAVREASLAGSIKNRVVGRWPVRLHWLCVVHGKVASLIPGKGICPGCRPNSQ